MSIDAEQTVVIDDGKRIRVERSLQMVGAAKTKGAAAQSCGQNRFV